VLLNHILSMIDTDNDRAITFADEMKRYSIEIWREILNHKFIIELSKGVLPLNKFLFYIKQDHYFLKEFAKLIQFATQKTTDTTMKKWLENLYKSTVDFEMKMQKQILDKLLSSNLIDADTKQHSFSPSKPTSEYTSYLVGISFNGNFGIMVSAMAPCPWTYLEIAPLLSKFPIENEIYRNWIQFYCSTESYKQVEDIKQILNILSKSKNEKQKEVMKEHFSCACKFEYLFWEMSYNLGNT
jgi:thiaminase (transcriptional activator TenA)